MQEILILYNNNLLCRNHFLVLFEEIALGVKAFEDLGEGELVAAAGSGKAFEEWSSYVKYLVAKVQKLWGFIKNSCVDDSFFMRLDKVLYLFDDDWIHD